MPQSIRHLQDFVCLVSDEDEAAVDMPMAYKK